MKSLHKLFYLLFATILVVSCSKYDDTELWGKVDNLDQRVASIEAQLSNMNSTIKSIQDLLNAQKNGTVIVSVTETDYGYLVNMSDGTTLVLRHGADGKDGTDGKDGKDGVDGRDGKDGSSPIIAVKLEGDTYYWTVTIDGNTTWLLDNYGNKIPAVGKDGKDGKDGHDAINGEVIIPLLKVDMVGHWLVSYDNGINWVYVTDINGDPVKATTAGSIITDVYQDGDYYVFVLANGTTIRLKSCSCQGGIIQNVIPQEILDEMKPYMPIPTGTTPPSVEGTYFIDPFTTVYCEDYGNGGYAPGTLVVSHYIGFFNQDMATLTLDYKGSNESQTSYEMGNGCYIQGSNNKFAVFFNTIGETRGIYTKTALLISGEKTYYGISNLHYAFVMVDKGDDPEHILMNKGVFRVFKDEDGFSEMKNFSFHFAPAKVISKNVDESSSLLFDFIKNE